MFLFLRHSEQRNSLPAAAGGIPWRGAVQVISRDVSTEPVLSEVEGLDMTKGA